MPHKNPGIGAIPNEEYRKTAENVSQYKCVSWHKKSRKWYVQLLSKKERKYGGTFNNELDAAKTVNQLCEQLQISHKNPGIGTMLNKQGQAKRKTSQYDGVCLHKKTGKWQVEFIVNSRKQYGGIFYNELNAAKRVNQLCEELRIPHRNHGIGAIPNEAKKKTSKYRGVYMHKRTGKWHVVLNLKGGQKKCGGSFNNELNAAKRVNQLCCELGIPEKNLNISGIQNQQLQVTQPIASLYLTVKSKGKNPMIDYKIVGIPEKNLDISGIPNQTQPIAALYLTVESKGKNHMIDYKIVGIPEKNLNISGIPNKWSDFTLYLIVESEGENPMIDYEIATTKDGKSSIKQYYFYDNLLKN